MLDQAAQKGVRIDTLSFIKTEAIRDPALTRRVRQLGSQPLTAVFTSMNAVEAVAAHLGHPDLAVFRETPWSIFCIGAATRRQVEKDLGPATGTAPSASELAAVVLERRPSEVFFFCGDQRREELPDQLTAAGIRVNEIITYRTTQTPHHIENTYDGIVFFSPSAVHSFFTVNTLPEKTPLFAIGRTTADAIRSYADNPVITSATPEKESLVKQIIDYFQKNI